MRDTHGMGWRTVRRSWNGDSSEGPAGIRNVKPRVAQRHSLGKQERRAHASSIRTRGPTAPCISEYAPRLKIDASDSIVSCVGEEERRPGDCNSEPGHGQRSRQITVGKAASHTVREAVGGRGRISREHRRDLAARADALNRAVPAIYDINRLIRADGETIGRKEDRS